jgi:F-type H+-transporting ATPase subunit epsilon
MHLKILLPSEVFADETGVQSIVVNTDGGSFGLLEHRLDCVATLAPGILTYVTQRGPVYLAVAEGVLARTGPDVLISVRQAIGGHDLGKLHDEVRDRFLKLNREETTVRDMISKMEGAFVGRYAEFRHER